MWLNSANERTHAVQISKVTDKVLAKDLVAEYLMSLSLFIQCAFTGLNFDHVKCPYAWIPKPGLLLFDLPSNTG